jgi:hypothetical protein
MRRIVAFVLLFFYFGLCPFRLKFVVLPHLYIPVLRPKPLDFIPSHVT